jgi:amidase
MRKLIETGLAQRSAAYVHANRARLAFRSDVMGLLSAHDALLSPTAPAPAPAGLAWTGDASLCAPWSFAGTPAVSVPTGLAASGLPLALQLVSAAGHEGAVLRAAAWCERVLDFRETPRL